MSSTMPTRANANISSGLICASLATQTPVCTYTLDAKDQRTSSALADGSSWAYGYDSRSQLASAVKSVPGVPDESFGYLYDDIGNRTSSTENDGGIPYTPKKYGKSEFTSEPSHNFTGCLFSRRG